MIGSRDPQDPAFKFRLHQDDSSEKTKDNHVLIPHSLHSDVVVPAMRFRR